MSGPDQGLLVQDTAITLPSLVGVLSGLHYTYPAVVFIFYMVSSAVAACTLQATPPRDRSVRRRPITALFTFAFLTHVVQCLALLIPYLLERTFPPEDTAIGPLYCILVFGTEIVGLVGSENPAWSSYIGSCLIGLVIEPAILALGILVEKPYVSVYSRYCDICAAALRVLMLLLIAAFYFCRRWETADTFDNDPKRQALKRGVTGDTKNHYGTTSDGSTHASGPSAKGERLEEKSLIEYVKPFAIFLPYIWPMDNRLLHIRAVLVGICLLITNLLNFLIPRQLGILINSLSHTSDENPWVQAAIYIGLYSLTASRVVHILRNWLWLPIKYYSYDAMRTAAYSHTMSLSADFYDSKDSSDIITAINSADNASGILEDICFSLIPKLLDIVVSIIYLSVTFGPYEGLVTIAVSITFLYTCKRMAASLAVIRRKQVSSYYNEYYVRQAGIQGWSTATYFNQIPYEERRHSTAVKSSVSAYRQADFTWMLSDDLPQLILLAGLLAGTFLVVRRVEYGDATPGDLVMFLTYWGQLTDPLSYLTRLGKTMSRRLIGLERLLGIMETKPTVINKAGAALNFIGGQVKFNNVNFSYDGQTQVLRGMSFSVKPGTTVAFVGASGSGKSTILKLLFQLYRVSAGTITIGGQDISYIDLKSLRKKIGVVPQSPYLFDDTIMYNVKYSRESATDEEAFAACKAAQIHEQIIGLTHGYNTKVGEGGNKLSGGELQRLAIARMILKRPSIVLLDEATSSVDTNTEQAIQKALESLCKGRTTFVVAHRLSTIKNAHRIFVIGEGRIIETGTHKSLLALNGRYAELWKSQG